MTIRVRQFSGLGAGEVMVGGDIITGVFKTTEPTEEEKKRAAEAMAAFLADPCGMIMCAPRMAPPPCKPGEQPILPGPNDCCGMASCTLAASDDAPPAKIDPRTFPPTGPGVVAPQPSSGKSPVVWGVAGAALALILVKLS